MTYFDDILLFGDSEKECTENVHGTRLLLEKLSFIVNREKSQLKPATKRKFLGFILNSKEMKIQLPMGKRDKVLKLLENYKVHSYCKIRDFASMKCTLGSSCLASKCGWAHMKDLERKKYRALKKNNDNFDAMVKLTPSVENDLSWWRKNIPHVFNPIFSPRFVMEIFSNASLSVWGACFRDNSVHGFWNKEERQQPINYLQLKVAFFGLKCFAYDLKNCDILLRIDNTTAISYINRKGGMRFQNLSRISKTIWQWCNGCNICILASYIRSKDKVFTDQESHRLEPGSVLRS